MPSSAELGHCCLGRVRKSLPSLTEGGERMSALSLEKTVILVWRGQARASVKPSRGRDVPSVDLLGSKSRSASAGTKRIGAVSQMQDLKTS